jgi:transposase InsO family protein
VAASDDPRQVSGCATVRRQTDAAAALQPWLTHYNFTRPHGALSHKAPSSRPRNYT